MKNRFITIPFSNTKIIIYENATISVLVNDKIFSTVDINNISPNGYDFKPFNIDEWDLIKIAGAFICIKDFLCWQEQKIKNINYLAFSYSLKHRVENQPSYQMITERIGEKKEHLSNGELMVAMMLLGFKMKLHKYGLNTHFNLSSKYYLQVRQ